MCKRREKIVFVLLIMVVFTSGLNAQDIKLSNYDKSTFGDLTKVLGRVIGSGFYHTGTVHQFPGGDIGVKTMVAYVPSSMRKGPLHDTSVIPIPVIQGSLGLVKNLEVGARLFGFKFGDVNSQEVNLISGFVKYRFFDEFLIPKLTLYSAYTRLSGISDFSMNVISFGGVLGYSLPIIKGYVGANMTTTRLSASFDSEGLYSAAFSETFQENSPFLTAGLSLSIVPFTQINAEYNRGDISTVTLGLIFSLF